MSDLKSMHLPPIDLGSPLTLEAVVAAVEICKNKASRDTKTPVGLVQEMCMKMRLVPSYEVNIKNGLSHKPTFVCEAVMGQFKAQAEGPSKKRAKHLSAVQLIKEFQAASHKVGNTMLETNLDDLASLVSQMKENEEIDPEVLIQKQNVLGDLIELAMKHNLRAPITQEEERLADGRFVFFGKIENFEERGYGPSKKDAKRDVATKLLNYLKKTLNVTPPLHHHHHHHRQHTDSVDFNDDSTINGNDSTLTSNPMSNNSADDVTKERMINSYYVLKNSRNPAINSLLANPLNHIADMALFVKRLCEEERIDYKFYEAPSTDQGISYILIVMTEPQHSPFVGQGLSSVAAVENACRNFLEFIKAICSR